jgi:hypothetical protein
VGVGLGYCKVRVGVTLKVHEIVSLLEIRVHWQEKENKRKNIGWVRVGLE